MSRFSKNNLWQLSRYTLSWLQVTKWCLLAWTCIQIWFRSKWTQVNAIQWKCIQVLAKNKTSGQAGPLHLLTTPFSKDLHKLIIVNPVYWIYTKIMHFVYWIYVHQKIKLTALQLITLRRKEPVNKQIMSIKKMVSEACPLTSHLSLAEKERYHRMRSVLKHFLNVILKESQTSMPHMTFYCTACRRNIVLSDKISGLNDWIVTRWISVHGISNHSCHSKIKTGNKIVLQLFIVCLEGIFSDHTKNDQMSETKTYQFTLWIYTSNYLTRKNSYLP